MIYMKRFSSIQLERFVADCAAIVLLIEQLLDVRRLDAVFLTPVIATHVGEPSNVYGSRYIRVGIAKLFHFREYSVPVFHVGSMVLLFLLNDVLRTPLFHVGAFLSLRLRHSSLKLATLSR